MTTEPLVSIIVPAYNCAKYISRTLDSLLEQDYRNIEIIVVNDGSRDNTLEILKSYRDQIVLIDQPNAGAPGARNNGLQAARGDFICFCDSDDLWSSYKVGDQVNYLRSHPSVGMVCSSWRVWNPDDNGDFTVPEDFGLSKDRGEIDPANSGWIYHKLLLDTICLTSAVMFRKETIDAVGVFDVGLWNGDDYDYWLRTSRITEIHRLKSEHVLYRILPTSVNRTPTRINYGYELVRKAYETWGAASPNGEKNPDGAVEGRLAQLCFEFGYLHYKAGVPLLAAKSFWSVIMRKPFWYLAWGGLLSALWRHVSSLNKSIVFDNKAA